MKLDVVRKGPLDGLRLTDTRACALRALPFEQRFVLRGEPASLGALQGVFGVAPPAAPLASAVAGSRAALWLGPDEWLLIAEDEAQSLEGEIAAALAGVSHSLVDVSHRNAALEVSGERAADALNFGVALDLDPVAFPAGQVARTLFVKAEIALWRRGETLWRVEVARSFAVYVAEMLGAAIAGLP